MTAILDLSEKVMGKVYTQMMIINRADQIRAEDGTIPAEQVRSITLNQVLVDTGATTLCLPSDLIHQLGLKLLGVIPLEMLGLEPDLKNQALRVLPTELVDTYLTIL